MALTKINNNTLSAVTTLPSAIATGDVLSSCWKFKYNKFY